MASSTPGGTFEFDGSNGVYILWSHPKSVRYMWDACEFPVTNHVDQKRIRKPRKDSQDEEMTSFTMQTLVSCQAETTRHEPANVHITKTQWQ
ncbi:hypothetical protein WJX77_005769 [Trebouxia sp. C0004]